MPFREGRKVGRSDATPIKKNSSYGHILRTRFFFDGNGISPSYFPALTKWHFWSYPSFHCINSDIPDFILTLFYVVDEIQADDQ